MPKGWVKRDRRAEQCDGLVTDGCDDARSPGQMQLNYRALACVEQCSVPCMVHASAALRCHGIPLSTAHCQHNAMACLPVPGPNATTWMGWLALVPTKACLPSRLCFSLGFIRIQVTYLLLYSVVFYLRSSGQRKKLLRTCH